MTPQQIEAMKLALEALKNNKLTHLYCEDTWYSCPKHEDGCANEADGDECNCGADDVNAQFDQAITALEEVLAQPEQEPLEYWNAVEGWVKIDEVREHFDSVGCGTIYKSAGEGRAPLYTTPPQRTPLTDEEIINKCLESGFERNCLGWSFTYGKLDYHLLKLARAIEAAHGIKENT